MLGWFLDLLFWKKRFLKDMRTAGSWKIALEERMQSDRPLSRGRLLNLGKTVYRETLQRALEDKLLSGEELQELDSIAESFGLDAKTRQDIRSGFAEKAISNIIELRMSDHQYTDAELQEIRAMGIFFSWPEAKLRSLEAAHADKLLRSLLKAHVSDRRLTPEEINEFETAAEELRVERSAAMKVLEDTGAEWITLFKLLAEIESGHLPVVSAPVPMQRAEVTHFITEAERLESKVMTTGYTAGSHGVSIRVARGISYRVGAARSRPIREEVTIRHPGTLIVTSKRIIFTARKKGFSIPLTKLTNFEAFSDGIGLQKDSTYYLMSVDQRSAELLPVLLTRIFNLDE